MAEVLKQDHPVLCHSRKLNNYQSNCPVTDKELLSIVDTSLDHESVLHGTTTHVCLDHKNLTHENASYTSARVQRQRLTLDEFGCTVIHIPGEQNALADVLSRFDANEKKKKSK